MSKPLQDFFTKPLDPGLIKKVDEKMLEKLHSQIQLPNQADKANAFKFGHRSFSLPFLNINLFTDAFATDDTNRLLFASIIGRNADVQSFIASIELKKMENLTIKEPIPDDPRCEVVGRWQDFRSQSEHLTKSITKVTTQNYGVLEHMFLYDTRLNKMDYGAKSTWMTAKSQLEILEFK